MKESFEPFEAPAEEESKISKEKIEEAKMGLEKLAQRLDILWQKDKLTPEEEKEVELILNNAMILDEIQQGKMPPELRKQKL